MRSLLFVALACAACGPAVGAPKPVPLASPLGHARTLEERKADVCRSSELVALEGPLVTTSSAPLEHGVVRSVRVLDAAGNAVEIGSNVLDTRQNAELDADAVRESIRRLWKTGRFDDVVVETSRDGDGVAVVFRVTPKREIENVFIASGDGEKLGLMRGKLYEPVSIVSAERSILDNYKKTGHPDASLVVSSAFADAEHHAVDVCVRMDPGPRVVLDKIDVRKSAYAAALQSELAQTDTKNVHGEVLDEDYLERDVLVLSAWLYDRGLLAHKIDKTVERHGNELTVVLDVTDGDVYRYGSIDVRGDLAAQKADYMKLVTAKRGDVFNRTAMMSVIDAFRALDKSKGHDAIEVEPVTELDTTTHTVALSFALRDSGKFSIVELAPGAGKPAKKGDHATVQYKGMLADGTVFDASQQHGGGFEFVVGGGMVIAGFDKGVTGMKVGGKRRVTIPPDMGYGSRGAPPKIPSNAVLIFEIELVGIR